MNLQKKLNMKLNIITCPSAVKKVLDFPCGKGLGDWVVPNLCEFSSKTRLLKSALSRPPCHSLWSWQGLGDCALPNLCEFSSKTRLLTYALSRMPCHSLWSWQGLGDCALPNLCEFSSKTRLLKSALSRTPCHSCVVARIGRAGEASSVA